jgi:CRP-like cAMP-binding protein
MDDLRGRGPHTSPRPRGDLLADWDAMSDELQKTIRETIENFPLFGHLSEDWRSYLADRSEVRRYDGNDTVIHEGDEKQDCLFVILDGEARVWTRSPKGKVHLETLEEGDHFGEVALLSDKVATATVEADSEVLGVLAIDGAALLELLEEDEEIRQELEGVTLERAKDTIGKVME